MEISISQNIVSEIKLASANSCSIVFDVEKYPVVYHSLYNVSFFGLEKLHPFDTSKWANTFSILKDRGYLTEESTYQPEPVNYNNLRRAHSKRYLCSLWCPCCLSRIVEVPFVSYIPPCFSDRFLLRNLRYQTGGTVLATRLALQYGWAINIGGGFHHASKNSGGGFCVYADISLAVKTLLDEKIITKVLIVDLDAHQGNGYERDLGGEPQVYIFDMFNPHIYPKDRRVYKSINRAVPLDHFIEDHDYLSALKRNLQAALEESNPDLVIYNAGTDCMEGDPLGGLKISAQGIIERDALVFSLCRKFEGPTAGVGVAMLTSGGYQKSSAQVIADSITNLHNQGLISLRRS